MTSETLSPDHIVDSTQLVPTPLSDDAVALREEIAIVKRLRDDLRSGGNAVAQKVGDGSERIVSLMYERADALDAILQAIEGEG